MNAFPRVYIGMDEVEVIAYHVAQSSIIRRSSVPVSITPVWTRQLAGHLWRYRDFKNQSNEFTFSRYLVPFLTGYSGWAIFMDSDVLMRDDIAKLWALRDESYAVMVVKHDYQPTEGTKYLGQRQDSFVRKNWSSVMLMNCDACKRLTKQYVNTASKYHLHQFDWLPDELIGELPAEWNHLVSVNEPNARASLAHYTIGIPPYYPESEFAGEWFDELDSLKHMKEWVK